MKTLCLNAAVHRTVRPLIFCLAFIAMMQSPLSAVIVNTSTGGTSGSPLNWSSSSTWTTVGSSGTLVYIIRAGDYVSFNSSNSSPYVDTAMIYGHLIMGNNRVMTLTSTGGVALMNNSATISGGSSNTQFQWNGTGATLSGPFTSSNIVSGGPRYATASTVIAASGNIQSSFVAGMLPVDILSFNTTCGKDSIRIHWSTALEVNLDKYEISVSPNTHDWQVISSIPAIGELGVLNHYTTFFAIPKGNEKQNAFKNNIYYFRMKIIENGGNEKVLNPSVLICNNSKEPWHERISVLPNPGTGTQVVTVRAEYAGDQELAIFDQSGTLQEQHKIHADYMDQEVQILLNDLKAGIYVARTRGNGQNSAVTFVRL